MVLCGCMPFLCYPHTHWSTARVGAYSNDIRQCFGQVAERVGVLSLVVDPWPSAAGLLGVRRPPHRLVRVAAFSRSPSLSAFVGLGVVCRASLWQPFWRAGTVYKRCEVPLHTTPPPSTSTMSAATDFETEWKKVQVSLQSGGFDVRRLLPRPKPVGDKEEEGRNTRAYHAKVKMLVMMNFAAPAQVLDWVAECEGKVNTDTRVALTGEFFKDGTYMCAKIDVAWRMHFLQTHFESAGLTLATLKKIDSVDKNGISMLMVFLAAIGPMTRIPEACLNKAVCTMWLKKRILQLGRCTGEKFGSGLLRPGGTLDWASHGVFRFLRQETRRRWSTATAL